MSDEAVTPEAEAPATEAQPEKATAKEATTADDKFPDKVPDEDYWKERARQWERRAKENHGDLATKAERLQAKLAEFEKAQMTEVERAKHEAEESRKQLDAFKAEAQSAKLEAMRTKIGAEMGLPPQLIERLRGEDADSIKADAEALMAAVKKDDSAWPDMGQGDKGKKTDADGFVDALNRTLGITT
jgi:hypothetical protein